MQVQVTGKKIEVSDALRKQALEKIEAIRGKYHLSPLEASVTFSRNGPKCTWDTAFMCVPIMIRMKPIFASNKL